MNMNFRPIAMLVNPDIHLSTAVTARTGITSPMRMISTWPC
jgi:hypothetical protein